MIRILLALPVISFSAALSIAADFFCCAADATLRAANAIAGYRGKNDSWRSL